MLEVLNVVLHVGRRHRRALNLGLAQPAHNPCPLPNFTGIEFDSIKVMFDGGHFDTRHGN